MSIYDDLLSGVDTDEPVHDICMGVFVTAVVTRHCGLAATLVQDALKQPALAVNGAGKLVERPAAQLCRMALSDRLLEAAVGMAAINSLVEVDMTCCRQGNAADLIVEKATGRDVAIVGHFPFVDRVRRCARQCWVIEKNPQPGDLDESTADRWLPLADVVVLTGTTLTNHSAEYLLDLCRPETFVIMVGASTPLSTVLFDHGVDAVCGTQVIDADAVLKAVGQGAGYRQINGVQRLIMIK